MIELATHRKLIADPSALGLRLFADWYRFGEPQGPVPVVHYIGGAISSVDYERRFETEPEAILSVFRESLPSTSLPCVDLIVSSGPPIPPERRSTVATDFSDHLWSDLLPQTPNSAPDALAMIGYSFGAHLATYLALDSLETRALAIVGAVGVREAARQTRSAHEGPLMTRVFVNKGDQTAAGLVAELRQLPPGVLDYLADLRAGQHEFRYYAENGSLADAFRFLLAMLE